MCLIVDRSATEKFKAENEGKTITVYKILSYKPDRDLLTSVYYKLIYNPGVIESDRQTNLIYSKQIDEGIHVCLTLKEAQDVLNYARFDGEHLVMVELTVNVNDLVGVGYWSDWEYFENLSIHLQKSAVFMKVTLSQEEYDKALNKIRADYAKNLVITNT